MEKYLEHFKDVIDRAHSSGKFPVEAKIALRGRIDYAVERGDITINESRILDQLIGEDIGRRYAEAFEIAAFGDLESDVPPETALAA